MGIIYTVKTANEAGNQVALSRQAIRSDPHIKETLKIFRSIPFNNEEDGSLRLITEFIAAYEIGEEIPDWIQEGLYALFVKYFSKIDAGEPYTLDDAFKIKVQYVNRKKRDMFRGRLAYEISELRRFFGLFTTNAAHAVLLKVGKSQHIKEALGSRGMKVKSLEDYYNRNYAKQYKKSKFEFYEDGGEVFVRLVFSDTESIIKLDERISSVEHATERWKQHVLKNYPPEAQEYIKKHARK